MGLNERENNENAAFHNFRRSKYSSSSTKSVKNQERLLGKAEIKAGILADRRSIGQPRPPAAEPCCPDSRAFLHARFFMILLRIRLNF